MKKIKQLPTAKNRLKPPDRQPMTTKQTFQQPIVNEQLLSNKSKNKETMVNNQGRRLTTKEPTTDNVKTNNQRTTDDQKRQLINEHRPKRCKKGR